MKIGVVIPVLKNFQQALDCISSVKSDQHEVKFYIQPQYHFQVPLAAAWNRGFTQAYKDGCDYILIVNDDVLLAPFSLDQAVEEFDALDREHYILYSFKNAKSSYELPLEIMYAESSEDMILEEAEMFSCFLVDKDFFHKCGTFDENFDPCFWEDNDMHYRIHLLGFKCYFSDTPFLHIGNQTTQFLTQNALQTGAEYFVKKWGSLNRGAPNWDRSFTDPILEKFRTPYNDPNLSVKEWRKLWQ